MALRAFAPITDWLTPWPIPCGQVRVMARRDISGLVFTSVISANGSQGLQCKKVFSFFKSRACSLSALIRPQVLLPSFLEPVRECRARWRGPAAGSDRAAAGGSSWAPPAASSAAQLWAPCRSRCSQPCAPWTVASHLTAVCLASVLAVLSCASQS